MARNDTEKAPSADLKGGGRIAARKQEKRRPAHKLKQAPGEIGGPEGPEPTRYGDWERKGIVSDF